MLWVSHWQLQSCSLHDSSSFLGSSSSFLCGGSFRFLTFFRRLSDLFLLVLRIIPASPGLGTTCAFKISRATLLKQKRLATRAFSVTVFLPAITTRILPSTELAAQIGRTFVAST